MLPADLHAIVQSLDRIDAAVTTLTAGLDDTQFNWQPHGGRAWSIGQCLDHLRVSSAVYLPPMSEGKEALFSGPYERRLIAGAGHFPQREKAAETASEIVGWLRRYR